MNEKAEESHSLPCIESSPSTDSSLQGGRLWKLAGEQVVNQQGSSGLAPEGTSSLPREAGSSGATSTKRKPGLLLQTFMSHTRSRADPDAPDCSNSVTAEKKKEQQHLNHSTQDRDERNEDVDNDDKAFFIHTATAQKRAKVAQLLLAGIVSILVGWMGNAFVGTSCHMASVQVQVGQNAVWHNLHFGLYKYSTVDSSMNGYKYCYPYSDQHEAPIVARIANVLALLAGSYVVAVVWSYLIFRGHDQQIKKTFWKWAIRLAWAAGFFQLSTLAFFLGALCRENTCVPGPAAYFALATSVIWCVVGWELNYHIPSQSNTDNADNGSNEKKVHVANLEMKDLAVASKEYVGRFQRSQGYEPPELA